VFQSKNFTKKFTEYYPQYEPVRNVLRTDYPLYSQSDYQILRN